MLQLWSRVFSNSIHLHSYYINGNFPRNIGYSISMMWEYTYVEKFYISSSSRNRRYCNIFNEVFTWVHWSLYTNWTIIPPFFYCFIHIYLHLYFFIFSSFHHFFLFLFFGSINLVKFYHSDCSVEVDLFEIRYGQSK